MQRPRILMLGWEFPPLVSGGLGVACYGLAKALAPFVELTILLPKVDPTMKIEGVRLIGLDQLDIKEAQKLPEFKTLSYEKLETIRAEVQPYYAPSDFEERILGTTVEEKVKELAFDELGVFRTGTLYDEQVVLRVIHFAKYAARVAATLDFDVVYAHDWMTFLAGVEVKKQLKKPLVLHVHSLNFDRGGPLNRGWIYDLERHGMQEADLVLAVSAYTGGIIQSHYQIAGTKIKAVHNGVDHVEPFTTKKTFKEKLVLFLGRVTEQKGPEFFLEIASKVMAENKEVRFVMAGTGDQLKKLIETGAYRHLGDKFHFTGHLEREKVLRLLSMTDVYCMPSVSEPFGLSAVEAAQFGIPAVISRQSGAAEVLPHALTADFWDVDLMAQGILELLGDSKLRKKVGEACQKDVKPLTWTHAAEKVAAHMRKVLA